jgi:hypothetical protein
VIRDANNWRKISISLIYPVRFYNIHYLLSGSGPYSSATLEQPDRFSV